MDAVTLKLFPTLVHKIRLKGWENYKDYLLDIIINQEDPEYRPRAGFYTDYGKHQEWRDTIWGEFIEPQIKPLLEQTNTKLQDIWAQRYIDLIGHSAHQHQPQGYSCVFYAEYDPSVHRGTTMFRPYLDPNDELNTNSCFTPPVEEGNILVFPSWMLHEVMPSDTDIPRTVIAFNLIPNLP